MAIQALTQGVKIAALVRLASKMVISIWNDCHNERLDANTRITRISLNSISIITQAAACSVDLISAVSAYRVGTQLIAGIADIFREGFQFAEQGDRSYSDYLRAFAVLAFRVGNIGQATDDDSIMQTAEKIILISGSILDFENVILKLKRWIIPENPLPSDVVKTNRPIKIICPITGNIIHKITVIIPTANSRNPIYYERQAIEKWFEDNPEQSPPGWPDGLAPSLTNVTPCLWMQDRMDARLDERSQDYIFTNEIKYKICDPKVSNQIVEDLIVSKINALCVGIVLVSIEMHNFEVEEEITTLQSRKIELKPESVISRPKPVEDCIPAARALLGSCKSEDRNALKEMMKNHYILNAYFSMDEMHYHIQTTTS